MSVVKGFKTTNYFLHQQLNRYKTEIDVA